MSVAKDALAEFDGERRFSVCGHARDVMGGR